MKTRRVILVALWANCLMVNATAETAVITATSCISQQASYLLATNSGALIRVTPASSNATSDHVIVFRPKPRQGWASQRLLKRFDLKLSDDGDRVVNTGAFCSLGE